jgi:hypothetical protein
MSGPEVEDSSPPAGIAAAAAKYLTASKPTHKHQGLWLRYVEKFAIHLFTLDVKVLAYALWWLLGTSVCEIGKLSCWSI